MVTPLLCCNFFVITVSLQFHLPFEMGEAMLSSLFASSSRKGSEAPPHPRRRATRDPGYHSTPSSMDLLRRAVVDLRRPTRRGSVGVRSFALLTFCSLERFLEIYPFFFPIFKT